MRTITAALLAASILTLHAFADNGPTWQEDPDAGSVPSASQPVRGTGVGAVNRINGSTSASAPFVEGLAGLDAVDLFEIDITSPLTFTVITGPEFDSRLFLFRKGGTPCAPIATPVAANHRRGPAGFGSELKGIPGLVSGTYYLAITGSPAMPRGWVGSGSGGYSLVDQFSFTADGLGLRLPVVPDSVLAEWVTPASVATGLYSTTVVGVTPKAASTCAEAGRVLEGLNPFDLAGGNTAPETLPTICDPNAIGGMIRTIWVRHTATCSGNLYLGVQPTSVSQNPIALAAWKGCCNHRTPVGCAVAPAPGAQAMTMVPVKAGDELLLAIGLRINSSSLPPPITGDLVIECSPSQACGDESAGSCFTPHDTPFCNAGDCCSSVCASDPYCCSVMWDQTCVMGAMTVCVETTSSPDINGDGAVNGKDLAILLSAWGG